MRCPCAVPLGSGVWCRTTRAQPALPSQLEKWRRRVTNNPIFVVGASRSGTSLIRSAINQHSGIYLAGETHYFDDLRQRMLDAVNQPLSPAARRVAEDYFLALSHRPYGHGGDPQRSAIGREHLTECAEGLGRGIDAYFEAFCRISAENSGPATARWGEKTPRHVFRIADIIDCYPDAQVICAVRDPRAVVASYRDWRHQGGFDLDADPDHRDALVDEEERAARTYDVRLATLMWRSTIGAAKAGVERFGGDSVRIQRYEDLVTNPKDAMQQMADWLGVPFEAAMTDVPLHNSSFSQFDSCGGVSTEPMRRWESKLSEREIATVQLLAGRSMVESGYDLRDVTTSKASLLAGIATLPVAVGRAAMANRGRMGSNLPAYAWRRFRGLSTTRRGS